MGGIHIHHCHRDLKPRRNALSAGCLLALWVVLAGGCGREALQEGLYAEIFTSKGLVRAKLEPELTPLAVANFVGLAEGTIENAAFDVGTPFYDGTIIHRVEPGHVIQTGIPRSELANGPGYVFPNEIHSALSHDHAGALNFANGGPHTNAGQWCITLGDRSYLDGDYIVFGNVVDGLDVVLSIVRDDVVDSVRIVRAGALAEGFQVDTESFWAMVRGVEARVEKHAALKARAEWSWVRRNFVRLDGPRGGVRTAVVSSGNGVPGAGGPVQVRYRGTRVRYVGHLLGHEGPPLEVTPFGSGDDGVPAFVDPPLPFTFEPGVTSLNPGLDAVIAEMSPGERRVVLVPPDFGYRQSGLYPPETPGERRFVIGPHTLLVYEVEVLPGG